MGDCDVCHTPPGRPDLAYAGGFALHAWFGTVFTSNITPDKQTGIGNWTAAQFRRALTQGIAANGAHLYPAFPYPYFTKLSRADTDALFAFLRTVKPVHDPTPQNRLLFPAGIRSLVMFWNALFIPQSSFHPDPGKSAEWNRGGEIVHGLGHCGGCHTPKTILFSDEQDRLLQGGVIDGWLAPDLTGTPGSGLGNWSVADLEQYLKTGTNKFGRVVGAMQDVVRLSTSRLTDADRHAIAVYLKSLPAGRHTQPEQPTAEAMQDGQAVFGQTCAVCHAADTKDYPTLANNSVVRTADPTTVVRVVLQGTQAVATPGQKIGYSMPAFGYLTNRQIADVVTYIRNSWGNGAGAVSVARTDALRRMLASR